MRIPRALLVCRSRQMAALVRQVVRLSTAGLEVVTSVEALEDDRYASAELLLIDATLLGQLPVSLVEGRTVIVVGAHRLDARLVELFEHPACVGFLADVDGGVSASDLLMSVHRLCTNERVGLGHCVPRAAPSYRMAIKSYQDKQSAIDWITSTAGRVGGTLRVLAEVSTAADELLSNALYPSDTPYAKRYATETIEPADVEWACAEGYIHVVATDRRGRLEKRHLGEALRRLLGGTVGLQHRGLIAMLTLGHRLVAEVTPGKRTEVQLSIHLGGGVTPEPPIPSVAYFECVEGTAARPMPRERRRHDRTAVDFPGRIQLDAGVLEALVVDLSLTGACLFVERDSSFTLQEGEPVTLTILVPMHGEVVVTGRVVRAAAAGDQQEIGIMMDSLGPFERDCLFRIVEGLPI